jgi:hypothetical protein
MAIVKQTIPYEMLTRFNADGSIRGQHIRYLDRVIDEDTGEVYAEKEGDALSVGDEKSAVMLETALGEVAAALAKAEETERTERAKLRDRIDEVQVAKEQADEQLEQLRIERDELASRIDEARQLGGVIVEEADANDNRLKPETIEVVKGRLV